MSGGPSDTIKRSSVAKDRSFDIYDDWRSLARNLATVALVSITVWILVSFLRFCIELSLEFLFEPFSELHSTEKNNHDEDNNQKVGSPHNPNKDFIIIIIFLVSGGLLRGLISLMPSWASSQGDGCATSLEHFHNSYSDDRKTTPTRYSSPDFGQVLRRTVLTTLTLGSGASGGLEAPVVPIGECIAAGFSRLFGVVTVDDLRVYQMAGMAAAVATLLDAPFTAALFAAEIVYSAHIIYRTLFYSMIGAMIAFALNNYILHFEPLFSPPMHDFSYTVWEYLEVCLVVFLFTAPCGLAIGYVFKSLKNAFNIIPSMLRPLIAALGSGLIAATLWFGLGIQPQHVLGTSEETIIQVMTGTGNPLLSIWWVLLLLVIAKTLATGLTLASGGSVGALVPAMYLGGISAAAFFYLLSSIGYHPSGDVSLFIVAGLASALVAVASVPLAAIAFVLEVFGSVYGPPAILSCALTYFLVRRVGISSST